MFSVLGHNNAVDLLKRSLEKGSVAHAYLFVGPAHVGKMTLAVNLAQALNCESPDRPCGKCPSCLRITGGKHADIQVIELEVGGESGESGKTRISVEQVDAILHSVNLPPFEGKHKVFIIAGADAMSIGAANRLLKTLEEPISRVVFILLTANESLVPATVISRCQRVELFPLPASQIENDLIANRGVEPKKASLLSRLSAGCPGWAITMVQNDALLQQRTEWLDEWLEIMDADIDRRFTFVAKFVDKFSQNRETVYQKLNLLLDWWHDLLLVRTGNAEGITNVDREDALRQISASYTVAKIRRFIKSIQSVQEQLRQNVNPQLAMEVLMLNVPENGKVRVSN